MVMSLWPRFLAHPVCFQVVRSSVRTCVPKLRYSPTGLASTPAVVFTRRPMVRFPAIIRDVATCNLSATVRIPSLRRV